VKKCFFPIDSPVVSCPIRKKNLGRVKMFSIQIFHSQLKLILLRFEMDFAWALQPGSHWVIEPSEMRTVHPYFLFSDFTIIIYDNLTKRLEKGKLR
jgi:hypothetical protein